MFFQTIKNVQFEGLFILILVVKFCVCVKSSGFFINGSCMFFEIICKSNDVILNTGTLLGLARRMT